MKVNLFKNSMTTLKSKKMQGVFNFGYVNTCIICLVLNFKSNQFFHPEFMKANVLYVPENPFFKRITYMYRS